MPNENGHFAPGNQGRGPSIPLEIEASELPEAIKVFQRYKALKHELATIHQSDAVSEQLRITLAQSAVIEFLQGDPEILESNIHKPLDDLHVALFELSCGGKPSILFEAQRPADVVTKQKTSYVHLAQGFLAAAFAAL
jgi:hypothetical protein